MKKYEFYGIPSGNGECFHFVVDKETYIRILGKDRYDMELQYQREWHNEVFTGPSATPFIESSEWYIDPSIFFDGKSKLKIKIEIEEI
jgi:hypothetical protein